MSQSTAAHDISSEVAGIRAAAYERDPEHVRTILDSDLAICVLRIALSPAEELLIAHHHDAVHDQRHAFEHALAPAFSAAVVRATGSTVVTFHTTTRFDPNLTLLLFTFAPAAATPAA